jgi:hypothetical protein
MAKEIVEVVDGAKWGRTRRMHEFRGDIIQKYKRLHRGNIIEQLGFYYGTIQVTWNTEGNPRNGNFTIGVTPGSPVIDSAFNLGIGDTSLSWFSTTGTPHILNPSDTNLQNPGQNLFADELFIIEAISARVRGLRIGYSAASIATMYPAPTGNTLATLQGNQMVWDQFGQYVPLELFNRFADSFRLPKTLEEAATLHFKWTDSEVGGSSKVYDKLIDSFLHVTDAEKDLKRTSGGASTLDLPCGYIWCLDKNFQAGSDTGGNGIFDAEIQIGESISYPFKPVVVYGSRGPVLPVGVAMYWELRLHGTSLLPGDVDPMARVLQQRRKVA